MILATSQVSIFREFSDPNPLLLFSVRRVDRRFARMPTNVYNWIEWTCTT